MENDWISLLKRIEKATDNTLLVLKIYSDESGVIENDDKEIMEFRYKAELIDYVHELEYNNKYKKFYDILKTFTKEDFNNTRNRFADIRKEAFLYDN